jgi:hypothetical protein
MGFLDRVNLHAMCSVWLIYRESINSAEAIFIEHTTTKTDLERATMRVEQFLGLLNFENRTNWTNCRAGSDGAFGTAFIEMFLLKWKGASDRRFGIYTAI